MFKIWITKKPGNGKFELEGLPPIERRPNAGIIPQAEEETLEVGEVGLVDAAEVVKEEELVAENAILGIGQGNRQLAIGVHQHSHAWRWEKTRKRII